MPRYRYTDSFIRIFPLQVGPDVVVEPAVVDGEPPRPAPEAGSTVELHPGDHLTTREPLEEHAHLVEVEVPATVDEGPAPTGVPTVVDGDAAESSTTTDADADKPRRGRVPTQRATATD